MVSAARFCLASEYVCLRWISGRSEVEARLVTPRRAGGGLSLRGNKEFVDPMVANPSKSLPSTDASRCSFIFLSMVSEASSVP